MFEKEIKFISDFTVNKINYLGSYFTYNELFNSDINPAILKFVSAEVDYKIYEDRKRLFSQSSFNYSGSQVARYFNLIGKEIKKSQKITYHDIKDIINQAVAFNIDYTIIPNESLLSLFFDKKQEIKAEDLKYKLNYIYYYPHIKDILIKYIEKKNASVLSSSVVKKILDEISRQIIEEAPETVLEDALKTISDFYNIGNTGNNKISIYLIETYLEKNNFEKYLKRLNAGIPQDSKQKFDIEEIKGILLSSVPVVIDKDTSEEPASDKEAEQTVVTDEEISGEDETNTDIEEDSKKTRINEEIPEESDQKEVEFDITEHENLDSLYNFAEEDEDIPAKEEDTIKAKNKKAQDELKTPDDFREKEAPTADKEENLDKNEPLKSEIKFEEEKDRFFEEPVKKTRNKDIFSYLSDKEIEKIVGNVFNDDRDDFASTMERITESDTYEEATEILKSVFKSYNVNPYAKDAITFTNSVSNYFEQT